MRRRTPIVLLSVTALAAVGLIAAQSRGSTGTDHAAPEAGLALAAAVQRPYQCRDVQLRPSAALAGTARVCARYESGQWQGSGTVHLRALAAASGAVYPGGIGVARAADVKKFSLEARDQLHLSFSVHVPAAQYRSEAQFRLSVSTSLTLPTSAKPVPVIQSAYSPVVRTAAATSRRTAQNGLLRIYREFDGATTGTAARVWPVTTSDTFGGGQLTVKETTLTYASTRSVHVQTGQLFGSATAASTDVTLPSTGGAKTTVKIPGVVVDVLAGEERLGKRTIRFNNRELTQPY